jgi:hypothetical protein
MRRQSQIIQDPQGKAVIQMLFLSSLQENNNNIFNKEYCMRFKNSLIIHEENTKKNHKRVVSLYVDKDFPSFT